MAAAHPVEVGVGEAGRRGQGARDVNAGVEGGALSQRVCAGDRKAAGV